jgi:hypothetical protein
MTAICAPEPTALAAVKLIPKERAARLARIVARDGTPMPERWYLLVQDPDSENGLHEFVVANNEVVASRPISQFAETLKQEDVIGGAALKIDSDYLAKLARQYAQANGESISKINYELKKDGIDATPVWKITCLGENDQRVGEIVVTAGKGSVVSHDGFAVTPQTGSTKKSAKFDVYADSQVAKIAPTPPRDEVDDEPRTRGDGERRGGVGRGFSIFGGKVKRFFTGH